MTHELLIAYSALILSILGLTIQFVRYRREKVRRLRYMVAIDHFRQFVDEPIKGVREPRMVPCLKFTFMNLADMNVSVKLVGFRSIKRERVDLSMIRLRATIPANKSQIEITYGDPVARLLRRAGLGNLERGRFIMEDDFGKQYKSKLLRLSIFTLEDTGKKSDRIETT